MIELFSLALTVEALQGKACQYSLNVSSFLETKKIFPRDEPFPLKSWLELTYPLLIAASLDTFYLVASHP